MPFRKRGAAIEGRVPISIYHLHTISRAAYVEPELIYYPSDVNTSMALNIPFSFRFR